MLHNINVYSAIHNQYDLVDQLWLITRRHWNSFSMLTYPWKNEIILKRTQQKLTNISVVFNKDIQSCAKWGKKTSNNYLNFQFKHSSRVSKCCCCLTHKHKLLFKKHKQRVMKIIRGLGNRYIIYIVFSTGNAYCTTIAWFTNQTLKATPGEPYNRAKINVKSGHIISFTHILI